MARVQNFQDLEVWQKAHAYALLIYKTTSQFDAEEKYGLSSQLRRAVVSVSSNIAEGFDRGGSKEFNKFLLIARGSLAETQAQLLLSKDLGYISTEDYRGIHSLSVEVHKMINGLRKHLNSK